MHNTIRDLAKYFSEFPGIGERQSKRFVYFLLTRNKEYLEKLSELIETLKKEISQCPSCFRYFQNDNHDLCDICGDTRRDQSMLMVIEKDADLESMERSGAYKGLYFVLGGLVPVVEKDTPRFVRIGELKDRITKNKYGEIILAFSLSPQGDHTDVYIRRELSSLLEKIGTTLRSLGRGLSTGTELEYSDKETLANAMKNRQ